VVGVAWLDWEPKQDDAPLSRAQLAFFANLIANHGAGSRPPDCSQRAAKNRIPRDTAQHSASTGSNLRIAWAGAATAQCNQAGKRGCYQEFFLHDGSLQSPGSR